MICTFFGHRDCPEEIYPMLYDAIETLIRQRGVRCFALGIREDLMKWRSKPCAR